MNSSEPLEIVICAGTTCYVMGGADLLLLAENPPAEWAGRVVWRGCGCLGLCRTGGAGEAPFVQVGDRVYSRMDCEKLQEVIRHELR